MDGKKLVLLMTATVDPLKCPDSKFSPSERAEQYKAALRYNLKFLNGEYGVSEIVFAENSGCDLSLFRTIIPEPLKNQVEFLGFHACEFDSALGKSYNEELLIDKVLDSSRFLSHGDRFFVKVTGRYPILTLGSHISDCVRRLPNLDWICDVKEHKIFSTLGLKWNETWSDTRCFGFRVNFYRKYIYGHYREFGPNNKPHYHTIEAQMYSLSRKLREQGLANRCAFRFKCGILIGGLDGRNKVQIANIPIPTVFQRPVFYVRWFMKTLLRRLFPFLWI